MLCGFRTIIQKLTVGARDTEVSFVATKQAKICDNGQKLYNQQEHREGPSPNPAVSTTSLPGGWVGVHIRQKQTLIPVEQANSNLPQNSHEASSNTAVVQAHNNNPA